MAKDYKKSIVLGLDISDFKKSADQAKDEIKEIDKACDNTADSMKNVENASDNMSGGLQKVFDVSNAMEIGINLATEAVQAMIQAIQECINVGTEYADTLDSLSKTTGWDTDLVQQWDYVASQSGTSVDKLASGYASLEKQMQKAFNGSKASLEAFDALGISVKDASGNMRDADEVFMQVVDGLKNTKDATTKAQTGMKLLGGSFDDLSKLIETGSADIREMQKNLKGLMTQDEVNALVEYGDAVDKMQYNIKLLESHLGAAFAEKLNPIIEAFNDFDPEKLADAIWSIGEAFNFVVKCTSPLQKTISDLSQTFKILKGYVNDILEALDEMSQMSFKEMFQVAFSSSGTGHNAQGTDSWRGGWTWVGEEGPELVNIPSGSSIYNNNQSNAMASNTYNITMNCDLSQLQSVSDVVDAVENLSNSRRGFA